MLVKSVKVSAEQRACRNALLAAVQTQMREMPAAEVLAILSHVVGQVVALQDQRVMTPAAAMELVALNIEQGNAEAVSVLASAGGARQ